MQLAYFWICLFSLVATASLRKHGGGGRDRGRSGGNGSYGRMGGGDNGDSYGSSRGDSDMSRSKGKGSHSKGRSDNGDGDMDMSGPKSKGRSDGNYGSWGDGWGGNNGGYGSWGDDDWPGWGRWGGKKGRHGKKGKGGKGPRSTPEPGTENPRTPYPTDGPETYTFLTDSPTFETTAHVEETTQGETTQEPENTTPEETTQQPEETTPEETTQEPEETTPAEETTQQPEETTPEATTQESEPRSCDFVSKLIGQSFGAGTNPCSADDCRVTPCNCQLEHNSTVLVSANICDDNVSFAVTDTDGTCVVREMGTSNMNLNCNDGVLTATNFVEGQEDVANIAMIQCPIFNVANPIGVCP